MKKGIIIPLPVPIRCPKCSKKVLSERQLVSCACCYRQYCEECVTGLRRYYMEYGERVEAVLRSCNWSGGPCLERYSIAVALVLLEELRKTVLAPSRDPED